MLGFLLLVVIGLMAGWLANMFTQGGGLGTVGNIIVGVVGSFLGGLLFQQFGKGLIGGEAERVMASFGVALVAAAVLLFVVIKLKK